MKIAACSCNLHETQETPYYLPCISHQGVLVRVSSAKCQLFQEIMQSVGLILICTMMWFILYLFTHVFHWYGLTSVFALNLVDEWLETKSVDRKSTAFLQILLNF